MDDQIADQEGVELDAVAPSPPPHIRSRLAKRALVSFCLGFAARLVAAPMLFGVNRFVLSLLVLSAFLLMFVSGLVFIGASMYPEAKAFKQSGYRFRLFNLFEWMTVIAVAIGAIKILLSS